MNRAAARIAATLLLMGSIAGAVPGWMPRSFVPFDSLAAPALRYFAQESLAIDAPIHRVGTAEFANRRVVVHSWLPERASGTVFLVHGYYNQCGVWSEHIRRFVSKGLAVVAFDLPGQGLSDGARMDVDSVGSYVGYLRAVEDSMRRTAPQPWSLAGHSLGGAIALERAKLPDYPYSRTLLLAPMVRYSGWGWTGLVVPVLSLFRDQVARGRKLASSSDTNFLRRVSTDPMEGWTTSLNWLSQVRKWHNSFGTPRLAKGRWLVLQGRLDATVDWKFGIPWIRERIPEAEILWAPLARHHLHNEGGRTGAAVRRAMDEFLTSPLPDKAK